MERIKQAVEKARQEREQAATPPGAQPATSVVSGPAPSIAPTIRPVSPTPPEHTFVYTQTRVLLVSEERFRRWRVHAAVHNDAISDAYKVLRTGVLQRMRANGWGSLAITSPTRGAGKTLTSVNLAISMAREVNNSVLLVDLDLRRPRVHAYFSDEPLPGISDYLNGESNLSDILFNPGVDRLVVLPGHKAFANSSEMLSSPRMAQLAKELKSRYPSRVVLYDMPPLLECDDMMAFAPHVDAVLLVVEEGGTTREELQRAAEVIEHLNLIGTVLNKSQEERAGYGYY
jgi:capsular exopolysaccharide synthesis family protein